MLMIFFVKIKIILKVLVKISLNDFFKKNPNFFKKINLCIRKIKITSCFSDIFFGSDFFGKLYFLIKSRSLV